LFSGETITSRMEEGMTDQKRNSHGPRSRRLI
jgi:hypothetical protein